MTDELNHNDQTRNRRFYREPLLAPAPDMVRYLTIFQRFFVAVDDYTRHNDKDGMLLGGHLADALHNVPALLWHYGPEDWSGPEGLAAWMRDFPDKLRHYDAPARLVKDSKRVLSSEDTAKELHLSNELTDFDAPHHRK